MTPDHWDLLGAVNELHCSPGSPGSIPAYGSPSAEPTTDRSALAALLAGMVVDHHGAVDLRRW